MKMIYFAIGLLTIGISAQLSSAETDYRLIDDFSESPSQFGTAWEGFTDRVMGGRSDMSAGTVRSGEEPHLWMRGRVSLENNGGFIQVRLMLTNTAQMFDGSAYKGVRIRVRGKGDGYYIHLRTGRTLFPWKYYSAPLPVSEDWVDIDLPWSTFQGGDYGSLPPINVNKLKSLAVVAAKREFEAEIDVSEIGFYR